MSRRRQQAQQEQAQQRQRDLQAARYRQLHRLLEGLPQIACQQKCQACCGPIALFPIERERLESEGLPVPQVITSPRWGELTCSALDIKGNCAIYAQRPSICWLFGLTPALKCPFGCVPERWFSEAESQAIQQQIHRLGRGELVITLETPQKGAVLVNPIALPMTLK